MERAKPIVQQLGKQTSGRTVIIGDVHGCYNEFLMLLDKAKFNEDVDRLVMVGDLVNKGPQSLQVVRKCKALNAHCAMGNHELTLLQIVDTIESGCEEELERKDPVVRLALKMMSEKDGPYLLRYLRSFPHAIQIQQYNVLVVHAGLDPRRRLTSQDPWEMMHMRRIQNDGTVTDGLDGDLWGSHYHGPQLVVFGHDARTGLQKHNFAYGIDTSCVYGGHLSALMFPGCELLQVQSQHKIGRDQTTQRTDDEIPVHLLEEQLKEEAQQHKRKPSASPEPSSNPSTPMSMTMLTPSMIRERSQGQGANAFPTSGSSVSREGSIPVVPSSSSGGKQLTPGTKLIANGVFLSGFPIPPQQQQQRQQPEQQQPHDLASVERKLLEDQQQQRQQQEVASASSSSPQSNFSPTPKPNKAATANNGAPTPSSGTKKRNDELLLRQTRAAALEVVSQHRHSPRIMELLQTEPFEEMREDLVEDPLVPCNVWVVVVTSFARDIAHQKQADPKYNAELDCDEMLHWIKDVALAREDVRELVGAQVTEKLAPLVNDAAAHNCSRSKLRSTLVALRI